MESPSFGRVLERLDRVSGSGSERKASCPVAGHGKGNGDRNPSMSVTYRADQGQTLVHCQAGCHPQDVLMALGLDWSDLWDEPITTDRGQKVAEWRYQRPDGEHYFTVERWNNAKGKSFVQRVPGQEKAGYPAGFQPCLYDLPRVLDQAAHHGEVYLVEGEKCVSAARALGLTATCAPNGVNGWRGYYWHWLDGASQVTIIADHDEPGHRYAAQVSADLRGHGIRTRVLGVHPSLPPKSDLYEHVLAGYGVADLVPLHLNRLRPEGATMSRLLAAEFPAVRWAVPGLISAGLTLFGGAPKLGKSYVALDLALGVAVGGKALSGLDCDQGSVLLLALDNDTERRIKERSLYLWGGKDGVPGHDVPLEVHTNWPVGTDALAACQEWALDTPNPLMVVIDTLVKVEPYFDGNGVQNAYACSTDVLSRWARFAADANIAVVAIHHDRKRGNAKDGEDADWLDRFTGSRGITAAAQTLLMLDARRGEDEGTLRVAGRDIENGDRELRRVGRSWAVM